MEAQVNKTEHWPKSWCAELKDASFYFRSERPGMTRLVAWTADLAKAKRLFYASLESFPEEVGVLLKRKEFPEDLADKWQRYHNDSVSLESLLRAISENESLIFRESDIQLCVKFSGGDEYIVFDEWGAFFAYSSKSGYDRLCELFGFQNQQPDKHVSNYEHFENHPAESPLLFADFVKRLALQREDRQIVH